MLKLFLTISLLLTFSFKAYSVQKIILGTESINYYPLYGIFDGNDQEVGRVTGIIGDLIDLYNKSQKEYVIIPKAVAIKRLYQDYFSDNSDLDAKFPDNKFWGEDIRKGKNIKYSLPIINYTDGVFVLDDNKSAKVLNIKTMGIINGFTPFEYLKEINSGQIKLEESKDSTSLIEKLYQKKIDTIYINKFIAQCKISKLKYKNLIFSDSLPHTDSQYYFSSIKHPDFIKSFDAFFKKHQNDIDKIKKSYFDKCSK